MNKINVSKLKASLIIKIMSFLCENDKTFRIKYNQFSQDFIDKAKINKWFNKNPAKKELSLLFNTAYDKLSAANKKKLFILIAEAKDE